MPKQIHQFHDTRFLAPGEINALQLSPDGTQLIAYCGDYKQRMLTNFDLETGNPIKTINIQCNDYDFTFYQDGQQLCYADEIWGNKEKEYFLNRIQLNPELKVAEIGIRFPDNGYFNDYLFLEQEVLVGNCNSLLVFERKTNTLTKELKGPWTDNSNGIAISPDGELVAFGNMESNEVQVFDIATGKLLKSFTVGALHDQHGAHIDFLPNSHTLFVAANLKAELWDAEKGTKIREIKAKDIYRCNVMQYSFSKDGQYLLAFYTGLHLGLFRLSDGQQIWMKTNLDGLYGFCFSADAKTVYYSQGAVIKQVDTLTGESLEEESEKLGTPPQKIYKLPGENTLLALFGKQALRMDADDGKQLGFLFGDRSPNFYYNEFDPEAAFNLLCGGDYSIYLFNAQSGRNKVAISTYYGRAALSSSYIAATDGYMSNRKVKQFNIYNLSGTQLHQVAKHQKNTPVYGMHFLSDGIRVFGIGEKFIALWNAETGTEIWKVALKGLTYTQIKSDEEGKFIYFSNNKGLLYCIDTANGNTVWEYKFPEKKTDNQLIALFPLAKYLLLVGNDGDLRLLDAAKGKELKKETLTEAGNACACLEDSKLIVIHSNNAIAHYDVSDWLGTAPVEIVEKETAQTEEKAASVSPFIGKNLLFTGTLTVPRKEAEAKAVEAGATIISGVSKKLDYLVVGEDAGSKLDKARRMGVAVLNEGEFWNMLMPKKQGVAFSLPEKPMKADKLLEFFNNADWSGFDWEKDAEPLRDLLLALEQKEGLQEVHQFCSQKMQELAALNTKWSFFKLQHRFGHLNELVAYGLSPDGKYLATGSWVGDDYYAGGELMIWEMATGRCVNILDEVNGGVGWPDYAGCLKWSPDGSLLGMALDTNGVAAIKPFADTFATETEAYLTDGWSRPPQWCWHPEGKALYISCWGLEYFLPGQVVPIDTKPFPLSRDYGFNKMPKNLFTEEDLTGDLMENEETKEQSPLSVMNKPGWSSQGLIFGNDNSFAFTQDPMDRSLVAVMKKVSDAAAWSADGSYYLYPIGRNIEVYNISFKQLCVLELGMEIVEQHPSLKFNEIQRIYWHPDEKLNLFAAIVYGQNSFAAIYKELKFVGIIQTSILEIGRWDMGDVETLVFSPDGTTLATLSPNRKVTIWNLADCKEMIHFQAAATVKGILLGANERLLAINEQQFAFYETKTGTEITAFQVGLSNGDPAPGLDHSPLGRFAERFALNPFFPIINNEEECWVGAFQTGLVIADNISSEKLDVELCYTIGNRIAWPYRWVPENRVDGLETAMDNSAFPFPASIKKQMAKTLLSKEVKSIDRNDYFMSLTKKELFGKNTKKNGYTLSDNSGSFWKDTKKAIQIDPLEIGLKAAKDYKLVEKLTGDAINLDALKALLGKVVLYVESYSPTRVQLGTVIQVTDDYCQIFHIDFNADRNQGGSGSSGSSFKDLVYIGLAEPR